MEVDEFKALCEEVKNGSAIPERRLLFLKEMNAAMEEMHKILTSDNAS